MIDRTHPLPVRQPYQFLKLARSPMYHRPNPASDTTLVLVRRIDELQLRYSFVGARMLRDLLRREGYGVGRRQAATLMRRMGITVVHRLQPHPAYQLHPYLLR